MRIEDFLGLLISLAVFLFIALKNMLGSKLPQNDKMREFLKSLESDMAHEEPTPKRTLPKVKPPIPNPPKIAPTVPSKQIVNKFYEDLAKKNPYEVTGKALPSRARVLIRSLKSKKEMVLLHEIMQRKDATRIF